MIDIGLLPWIVLGFVLGSISGLTPGLHVNNFAALLLGASPALLAAGIQPFHLASAILAAAISQTFLDAIPAIFVGAPDAETVLAVLPGHRLMMDGKGIEAVRLSALGSAGAVMVAALLILPLSMIFGRYYQDLTGWIGPLLVLIATAMIYTENGPHIEGPGLMANFRYKAMAVLIFLTSGALGAFSFSREHLLYSPLDLAPQPLLPLLSGLFGASFLILSISTHTEIPEQRDLGFDLPAPALARSIFMGGLAGSLVAWIPGISPAVATLVTRLGTDHDSSGREFLVSVAGVNTSCTIFSLVALLVIGRPRSGAAAAIGELVEVSELMVWQMVVMAAAVGAASYLVTIRTARLAATILHRLNYRLLCSAVLSGLILICAAFTGPFGLLIFTLSTLVGLAAPICGVRKTHAMGVLMLPVIAYYMGWT